jgi:hypothetical protein
MMEKRAKSIIKDIKILSLFFDVYCSNVHKDRSRKRIVPQGILKDYISGEIDLCEECSRQFLYAAVKRVICPFDPKPACKKCPSICYSKGHRVFMREMMRYSGKYLIFHGRFDLIFKYIF